MSYIKKRLELFKDPSFTLQILSCVITSIGFGMAFLAMAWIVVTYSESVTAVAILMTCFWLPTILLSPILGVLVDRYERRWLVAFSNASRGLTLIIVALFYIYYNHIYFIYGLALVLGTFGALYIPAAFTLIRELIPQDKLLYANATIDMSYEVGFLIGAASSGFVIAWTSTSICLIINGLLFIIAALCILAVKLHPDLRHIPEKRIGGVWESFIKDLNAGFRYLIQRPILQGLYMLQLLVFVLYQTAPILLSPFVKIVLQGEAHEYGIIEAGLSAGTLLGGIILPYLAMRYEKELIFLANLGNLIGFALFAFVNSVTATFLVYTILGVFMSSWAVLMTRAQEQTDIAFQGRLTSLFFSLGSIIILGMYLLIGVISHYIDVRAIYTIEVIVAAIATFLSWRLFWK